MKSREPIFLRFAVDEPTIISMNRIFGNLKKEANTSITTKLFLKVYKLKLASNC